MFSRMSDEWKDIWKVVGLLFAIAILGSIIAYCSYTGRQTISNAFIRYEEFHDLYNAIKAIDRKICNMNAIPADDHGFKYQSKSAQLTGLRNLMEQRIADYNSKSSQWNRNVWKSSELPYRLEAVNFQCFPQENK